MPVASAAAAAVMGLLTASPANAGIGHLGAAVFGSKCAALRYPGQATATAQDPGLALSNLTQVPAHVPYNHCGAVDLVPDDILNADTTTELVPTHPVK
ncbi:chaplin family protein [Streptomyces chrestomyceticus]|uniref:chaplin family protein n=1 Tax=Streptomyces chrestomyceticus TaxID=68185 RepID=UPI00340B2CFC